MTTAPFAYTESFESPVLELKIIGDFRSGEYLESVKKKIEKKVSEEAISKLIVINLSQAIYWDTETMNFINNLLIAANKESLRAGITGDKNSYVGKRFFEKFGEKRFEDVWFEEKQLFLNKVLQS